MSVLGDIVEQVVGGALQEILKKTGTRKRARRRKRALTPSERLKKIEKLLKPAEPGPARTADGRFKKRRPTRPAKRQTSRRRTVRARSKAKRSSS